MAKTYSVCIPIAGHAYIEVEAESEAEAIEKALASEDLNMSAIEEWEALERFHSGNVCYCPSPWEATAEEA